MQLATLFSRTVVYFLKSDNVQSRVFADLCPAVTMECGQPEQNYGVQHAGDHLHAALKLVKLPEKIITHSDIDIFHTVVIIKAPEILEIGFTNQKNVDINFPADLDCLNIPKLAANTLFGWLKSDRKCWLEAWDDDGNEAGDTCFNYDNNEIRLKKLVRPSMLTNSTRVIRQDRLCYLMERIALKIT